MSHLNIGRLQVLWWPRKRLVFIRSNYVVYRWIVYVWPLEWRIFQRSQPHE